MSESSIDRELDELRVQVHCYQLILDSLLKSNRHNGEKNACASLNDSTAQCSCGKERIDAILAAAIKDPWNAIVHMDEILEHMSGSKAAKK